MIISDASAQRNLKKDKETWLSTAKTVKRQALMDRV